MSDRPILCSFESRRGQEMQALIERHGGQPVVVASMQEVPLDDNHAVIEFADQVERDGVHLTVFMTGVGARAVQETLQAQGRFDRFLAALRRSTVLVRGPKPRAVVRDWGLTGFTVVPEPNTWRELLACIDEREDSLKSQTVAVQEYGVANPELYAALSERGAQVLPVPVYKWALPDDTGPLERAVQQAAAGEFDALLFTSANQVRNVLTVATTMGLCDELRTAAESLLVASIGPTCSETLRAEGFRVGFEAQPPKMGPLVRGTLATLNGDASAAETTTGS